jgi:hypothetical protein
LDGGQKGRAILKGNAIRGCFWQDNRGIAIQLDHLTTHRRKVAWRDADDITQAHVSPKARHPQGVGPHMHDPPNGADRVKLGKLCGKIAEF